MDNKLTKQVDGLLEKYTEILLGESNQELKDKVQLWVTYSFIAKQMPQLVKHWNEMYPDGKEDIKEIIMEIKQLNEENRANK
ncbi:DUF2573 family protein [Cytobacillus purgationiresistens]|uniref:DUF2573 family protein n=1 Tax=Cytobacillus purgationiresistens TaxID=863449 RepID=A0ABU0ARH0_9BACI|nr:DUF2573 family protein [Cytobacillus purgationiresistens]MDQ0273018.1 hypothetical protein [Cytobacillus purgationiresistens]